MCGPAWGGDTASHDPSVGSTTTSSIQACGAGCRGTSVYLVAHRTSDGPVSSSGGLLSLYLDRVKGARKPPSEDADIPGGFDTQVRSVVR